MNRAVKFRKLLSRKMANWFTTEETETEAFKELSLIEEKADKYDKLKAELDGGSYNANDKDNFRINCKCGENDTYIELDQGMLTIRCDFCSNEEEIKFESWEDD